MSARMGSLTTRVAQRCDELLAELGDQQATARLRVVREGLLEPLRIAVAGRVSAGKSTLVNALLGRRIATTDVGECTRVVMIFRYGFPERVVIRPREGVSQAGALTVDGRIPEPLGVAPERTSSVTVELSNAALAELVLVDTPGLAARTETTDPAADPFAAGDYATRNAVSAVEALVYVLSRQPGDDDRRALAAFRELADQTGNSAATCVGVLGRSDELGDLSAGGSSALNPLAQAHEIAQQRSESLRGLVDGVVPVVGLWAETARSGALTEEDAAALALLAADTSRAELLEDPERFASAPAGVAAEQRRRLLALLGRRGVEIALAFVDAGCIGAAALSTELARVSGITGLEASIRGLRSRADPLKAQWALNQLDNAPLSAAGALALRNAAEELRLEPKMQQLNVLAALQLVAAGVRLPAALAEDVLRMATATHPAAQLGQPADTPPDTLQRVATEWASRWLAYAADQPRTGPEQEQVARLMYRSYAHLRMQVSGAFL
ncbi:MAG: dynamin family protein [Mycobacteriales bacterium]